MSSNNPSQLLPSGPFSYGAHFLLDLDGRILKKVREFFVIVEAFMWILIFSAFFFLFLALQS